MRFTMLRQDSRLKPLVRRSLSARETGSSTPPAKSKGLGSARWRSRSPDSGVRRKRGQGAGQGAAAGDAHVC